MHRVSPNIKQREHAPPQTIVNNIKTQNITNNNAPIQQTINDEVKALQVKIEQLELQNSAYKSLLNNELLPLLGAEDEYIYVLQERIAMELLIPVYKVGITGDIHKRSGQYAKGSKLLFCRVIKCARTKETSLHAHLRMAFKARPDFGREYIEGDINLILNKVLTFLIDDLVLATKESTHLAAENEGTEQKQLE